MNASIPVAPGEAVEPVLRLVPAALQTFRVQVKEGPQIRLSFEVLSPNKVTAQRDHECLCEPGEQCVVYTAAEWDRIRFQPRRLSALQLQQRQDDVNRVTGSNVLGGGW